MDVFSSSFISALLPQPKHIHIQPSSSPPQLNISSVKTEDPQPTVTASSTYTSTPTTLPNTPKHKASPTSKRQAKDAISTRRFKTPAPVAPPKPSFQSTILNILDDMINKFVDPPTRASVDPRFVLSGNFAPVEELPPTECMVIEGALPSCLDGAYIRNGPNPQFPPRGPYHLFDGDGMLHCIRISNGKATLCSRYVKTHKYMAEYEAGTNLLPNFFSGYNGLIPSVARGALVITRRITGQYDPRNGIGTANTSLAFFGNHLYALYEADLPYEVQVTPNGDIKTLGRSDFDGKLFMSMTAHPKIDLETGEAFAFRYSPIPPFLTYFRFDSKGKKQADVPIFSMPRASFMHDFAITRKYAIFIETQIGMDPMEIMRGGSPVAFDPTKVSRIGVIPRYATDEKDMRWFELPGFNILHAFNAWDEVDEDGNHFIIMVASNILSPEHILDRMDLAHGLVEKVKINLKTGLVSRQPLSTRNLDFGVINPAYVGKKSKYMYAAIGDPMPNITGVVKLDMSAAKDQRECVVASRMYGPGCYGGEPFFVARHPDNPYADEDDGYLVCYVHDENAGESSFIVIDAKSPCLDVVASVKLPNRVPYGFHGLFLRDEHLKNMT